MRRRCEYIRNNENIYERYENERRLATEIASEEGSSYVDDEDRGLSFSKGRTICECSGSLLDDL